MSGGVCEREEGNEKEEMKERVFECSFFFVWL